MHTVPLKQAFWIAQKPSDVRVLLMMMMSSLDNRRWRTLIANDETYVQLGVSNFEKKRYKALHHSTSQKVIAWKNSRKGSWRIYDRTLPSPITRSRLAVSTITEKVSQTLPW